MACWKSSDLRTQPANRGPSQIANTDQACQGFLKSDMYIFKLTY